MMEYSYKPFHTPSFGDEGFDLQPMMANPMPSNMLHQQTSTGGMMQETHTAYNNVVNQQTANYTNQQLYAPTIQTQSNSPMMSHQSQQQQQQQQQGNNGLNAAPKRPSPEPVDTSRNNKKPKVQKKKKKRDPNEPQKPVSAYALFFRDTQAAIKGQNPNASFGDVSKIVASMWDALDAEHKNVYKKKTELAKKEYLKALAAYRASLVSKQQGLSPQQQHSPPHAQALQQQQQVYYNQQYQPQQPPAYGYQPTVMNTAAMQEQQVPPPQSQQTQQQTQLMSGNALPSINEIAQHANYLQPNPLYNPMQGGAPVQSCIRAGCPNPAISNAEWQDEYCSNECVVSHCRDVFSSWVASNQQQNFSTVK
ncbi:hypothetical protein B566_EDAN003829 [Ephemera danica]|nr:hypothetical protein B566_EDAN003829 [Ephemera danica]